MSNFTRNSLLTLTLVTIRKICLIVYKKTHTCLSVSLSSVHRLINNIHKKKIIFFLRLDCIEICVFQLLTSSFIQKILYCSAAETAEIRVWSPPAILWQSEEWVKNYNHPLHPHRCLYNVQRGTFYCIKIDFEIPYFVVITHINIVHIFYQQRCNRACIIVELMPGGKGNFQCVYCVNGRKMRLA